MNITEYLLNEMNREVERSRRALQEVPDGKFEWKPHDKSMILGYLANMVATIPMWIAMQINQDELDVAPAEGESKMEQKRLDTSAELIEALDLKDLILVGHSTGGGEVAHYIGRHGTSRVAKVVLVGAVPPLMLRTDANPDGTPMEVFDAIREGTAKNRSQFYFDLTVPFYGFNRDHVPTNDGLRENFRRIGLQGGIKGQYDCIHEFSEVDYTHDLQQIDRPTLIIHGDDDQIVPIKASAHRAAEIVANATLTIYAGGSHGLAETEADRFNADVLAFIRS